MSKVKEQWKTNICGQDMVIQRLGKNLFEAKFNLQVEGMRIKTEVSITDKTKESLEKKVFNFLSPEN